MNILEQIFGSERVLLKDDSDSETFGGGDFDREQDHFLATYKVDENTIFVIEYKNELEHSMYKYFDEAFLKVGYYDKNGNPVAAGLLLDCSKKDKSNPRNIVLFGTLNIKSDEPNGVGTFEKSGRIYSGLFQGGKLHGFGAIFERVNDEIKLVDAGVFEDGNLLSNEINKIVPHLSLLNNFLSSGDKFDRKFKNSIMDTANQCDYNPDYLKK